MEYNWEGNATLWKFYMISADSCKAPNSPGKFLKRGLGTLIPWGGHNGEHGEVLRLNKLLLESIKG